MIMLSAAQRQRLVESAMEQLASALNKAAGVMQSGEHDTIFSESGGHFLLERAQHGSASDRGGGTTPARAGGTGLDCIANPVPPVAPALPANLGLPCDFLSLNSTIWTRRQEPLLGICNTSQSADFLVANDQRCEANQHLAKPWASTLTSHLLETHGRIQERSSLLTSHQPPLPLGDLWWNPRKKLKY